MTINSKCIIYLHGLGSSRLQALPLIQYLPKQYCLFCFDFAGSGKSEGDDITYGLREAEDIQSIIDYLKINKGIKQVILWGRSMGAVAALLYAINASNAPAFQLSSSTSKVRAIVADSPFSDFRQITKQIGLKKIKIPQFMLDFALNFIENSFNTLLNDPIRKKVYNPFNIKIGESPLNLPMPCLFVYSNNDEVVCKEHSQKIIQAMRSPFQVIKMQNCTHNQTRSKQVIDQIFNKLNKMTNKNNINGGGRMSRNKSMELMMGKGRRGISVESRGHIQIDHIDHVDDRQLTVSGSGEDITHFNFNARSYSSLKVQPRREKVSCKVKVSKNPYIMDSHQTPNSNNTGVDVSPMKIRLSASLNKNREKEGDKVSVSLANKQLQRNNSTKINNTNMLRQSVGNPININQTQSTPSYFNSNNNFYSSLEFDNSIVKRKLQSDKMIPTTSNYYNNNEEGMRKGGTLKGGLNCRRFNQVSRRTEYQLNHTRYL